ncbi:hypothetical protein NEOLEDRAFT_1124221 [Neolentinus lepideus HHB14362 ss-1]|uniref:RING-type domain-containing protein n=1 Tax=Neolentinus lepideus HHB14362 ss-1 TaxID=1314782 RepID=A0A165NAR4_9AGAM|nr:hypothetical protein NEOLEDRAFT_1124221 [Neolentinus lepideus HHB14362 ss-1]
MAAVDIDDEFNSLADPFAEVDWATVPELNFPNPQMQEQQGGETATNFPSIEGWSNAAVAGRPASSGNLESSATFDYFSDDLDESILAQVDELERREMSRAVSGQPNPHITRSNVAATPIVGTVSSSRSNVSRYFGGAPSNNRNTNTSTFSSSRRPRTPTHSRSKEIDSSPRKKAKPSIYSPPSAIKKGKDRDGSKENAILDILETFDDDTTCPICCDMFAAAHVGNPCGHSVCGECGWAWISKNRRHRTCAICREQLSGDTPMIPNYTLDSLVEKHINALGKSGDRDWLPGGAKFKDWHGRKEKWKRDVVKRAAKSKSGSSTGHAYRQPPSINLPALNEEDEAFLAPDDEEDESYQPSGTEEENELLDEVAEIVQDAISRALSVPAMQSETRGQRGGSRHRSGRGEGRGEGRGRQGSR